MKHKVNIEAISWVTLLKYVAIPLLVLEAYLVIFQSIATSTLPLNVNLVFSERMSKLLLLPIVISLLLSAFMFVKQKQVNETAHLKETKLSITDLIFVFLPLTPLAQYIVNNSAVLKPLDILLLIGLVVALFLVTIILIPFLSSRLASREVLISLSLSFMMTLLNMAALSQQFNWFEKGSFKIQLVVFVLYFFVTVVLVRISDKKLVLIVIALFFVFNTGFQLFNHLQATKAVTENPNQDTVTNKPTLLQYLENKSPVATPNIYLLVYDSYVSNETMMSYGFDNSGQETFLVDNGFVLYPHTYSVAANSLFTMRSVLDLSTNHQGMTRHAVAGNGLVQEALHDIGYVTKGIFSSDYFFRGEDISWDVYYPKEVNSSVDQIISAIAMGEFRFDIENVTEFGILTAEEHASYKLKVIGKKPDVPVFIYAHSRLPGHSQNSGTCLENETELYINKVNLANKEMRRDIETVLSVDPKAIVVVAGDHGPYLTKNCFVLDGKYSKEEITRLDLQDRFGTFLAIHWPDERYKEINEIKIFQDMFPAILAYLYNADSILQTRLNPTTLYRTVTSGAYVDNGVIFGGKNDGEALFLNPIER